MNRKLEFIAAKKGHCALIELHRAVGVSKSTWYRRAAATSKWSEKRSADQAMREGIRQSWNDSEQAYGAPRVTLDLQALGLAVNHKKVARIMREEGMFSCMPHRPPGTKPRPRAADVNDLVQRQFTATRANQVWVCDITQVRTRSGWLYLVCFIDLYSRRVVGHAMGVRCTTTLVLKAFWAAWRNRQPDAGLIVHTDRGPQFVAHSFQGAMLRAGCRLSMARPGHGHCADNAVAESFWASLKKERLSRWAGASRRQCQNVISGYMRWYNDLRRHSYLGGVSPASFELAAMAA